MFCQNHTFVCKVPDFIGVLHAPIKFRNVPLFYSHPPLFSFIHQKEFAFAPEQMKSKFSLFPSNSERKRKSKEKRIVFIDQ